MSLAIAINVDDPKRKVALQGFINGLEGCIKGYGIENNNLEYRSGIISESRIMLIVLEERY